MFFSTILAAAGFVAAVSAAPHKPASARRAANYTPEHHEPQYYNTGKYNFEEMAKTPYPGANYAGTHMTDYPYAAGAKYVYSADAPTAHWDGVRPTGACLITGVIIDNQPIDDCIVVRSIIKNSPVHRSILVECDVFDSQLFETQTTGGRFERVEFEKTIVQNAFIVDSELDVVAVQLAVIVDSQLTNVAAQISALADPTANNVALSGVLAWEGTYTDAVAQLAVILESTWNTVAFSLTFLRDITVTNTDIQRSVIDRSAVTNANIQDSQDNGNNAIVNALVQAPNDNLL